MALKKLQNFRNAAFLLVRARRDAARVPRRARASTARLRPAAAARVVLRRLPRPRQTLRNPSPKPQPKAKPANQTAANKKKSAQKKQTIDVNTSAEPDKVLYDRAQADLKAGRYTEGRLALQTLINTYPDSEYLAKAKLAVADSYYKEGGTTNLTQVHSGIQRFPHVLSVSRRSSLRPDADRPGAL